MNSFYEGKDHKEILRLLLLKGREEDFLINVLCKNQEVVQDLSRYLWNNSIPHHITGDPYVEKNNIFVSEEEMPADMIICFESSNFNDVYKYKKKCFIGVNIGLEGKHWLYVNKKWKQITK